MVEKDDWRLRNQEEYLKGKELKLKEYKAKDEGNHTHCVFCWRKFSEYEGDLREGYVTKNKRHWICPECFDDFKEMFNWELI